MSPVNEYKYENKRSDYYYRDTEIYPIPLECPAHLHSHVELGILLEGKTKVTIDSREHILESGDIFICFPNQVHSFKTLQKEHYMLLIFTPETVCEFSNVFFTKLPKSGIIKNAAENPELQSIIQGIKDAYLGADEHRSLAIKGYLLVLLSKLLGKLELHDAHSGDINLIGAILNYCSQNYDRPISLSMLERELHVSKFYISHTLSNKFHISFNDYVNSLRVINACKLLRNTAMSVTEISDTVGFNTLRTFNRAFIKHAGTTPSKYRAEEGSVAHTSLPL